MLLSDTFASTLRATGDNLVNIARERIEPAWVADACQRAELDAGGNRAWLDGAGIDSRDGRRGELGDGKAWLEALTPVP